MSESCHICGCRPGEPHHYGPYGHGARPYEGGGKPDIYWPKDETGATAGYAMMLISDSLAQKVCSLFPGSRVTNRDGKSYLEIPLEDSDE